MAEESKKASVFANLKDVSAFLRDALLTLVVAVCIFNPASIKAFLTESGLSKLGVFGVTVELKEEQEKIAQAQEKINAQMDVIASAEPDEAPPESRNQPVDQDFKQAVLTAQRIAPQILPSAGWVFLGRVTADKSQWIGGQSDTTTAQWPLRADDVITVKDDVYVRQLSKDTWHSRAPVASVAKVGDRLKVVELDYSSAKVGGYFVWAKVAIMTP